MFSDRPYMRDHGYGRQTTSVLIWMICAIVAAFVVQILFLTWFRTDIAAFLELSAEGLRSGRIWTLLTYGLMHHTGMYLHVIGNLLGLYFIGREVLPFTGSRRFVGLFAGAVFLGGLLWTATHWSHGGAVVGASAGVVALLIVFASMNPNQPITLLLFFILPVTLKPKWIAISLLTIDLCGFIFYELAGNRSPLGFAHSAHLGGMAAGWIYFRYVHQREWAKPDRVEAVELPRWFKRAKKLPPEAAPTYKVNLSSKEDVRAEVDRILDKINSEGFGALTPDEKRLLDDAREALGRH